MLFDYLLNIQKNCQDVAVWWHQWKGKFGENGVHSRKTNELTDLSFPPPLSVRHYHLFFAWGLGKDICKIILSEDRIISKYSDVRISTC